MFTKAFGDQMIAATATGNPAGLARQITWAGHTIGHHPTVSNTTFGLIQLFIALGIAWRPTVKIALGASVVWASECGGSAKDSVAFSRPPPAPQRCSGP